MPASSSNGQFRAPFDPTFAGYGSDGTEGHAWQYSWYLTQDVRRLIEAMGRESKFMAKLDQVFDAKVDPAHLKNVEDMTGLISQMSAWCVFTAMGFYPVTPASDVCVIGRPCVSRATIHSSNGHSFTVSAAPKDDAHSWIGAATLNGKPLDRTCLRHAEILAGVELHFSMQAAPNRRWGSSEAARPPMKSRHGS